MNQSIAQLIPRSLVLLAKKCIVFPRVGRVDWGDLKRLSPISRKWGFDRGQPIDRFYIENFLSAHKDAIRGHCLEIGDDRYIRTMGGEQVTSADVLHYREGYPGCTLIGDLVSAPQIESDQFDCIICTQTLQFVSDPAAAIKTLSRILKPGGTLLLTVPCLSQLDTDPAASWSDRWRFTSAGIRELFCQSGIDEADYEISKRGNVLTATSFLHGMSVEELDSDSLYYEDDMFELVVFTQYKKPRQE